MKELAFSFNRHLLLTLSLTCLTWSLMASSWGISAVRVSSLNEPTGLDHKTRKQDFDSYSGLINHEEIGYSTAVESSRIKRHTADHIINDQHIRNMKSQARKRVLIRLLNLVGSSPNSPCDCQRDAVPNSHDPSSRLKDRPNQLLKRLDPNSSLKCNCGITSFIKFLLKRLSEGKAESTSTEDPLGEYLSKLSNPTKVRLSHFLHEEMLRIRKTELLRLLRRRRKQMQMLQRMRLLRNDPGAAFRGKIFLSF